MIAHVVLLAPRPGLTEGEREAFIRALEAAARDIPTVRRVQVGRRVRHGAGYEAGPDFPFAAIFEFDDLAGLKAYLGHPAHGDLAAHFSGSLGAALARDYDLGEVGDVRGWFPPAA